MKQRTKRTVGDIPGLDLHWSSNVLKWIGFICIFLGTFSTSVIQQGILGLDTNTTEQMLSDIAADPTMALWINIAAAFAMVSYLALPIYARLAVEGSLRTSDPRRYLVRVIGLALLAEIPYDLATAGVWNNMSSQNPVWGLALAVLMLNLFRQYVRPGTRGSIVMCLVMLMAAAWTLVLQSYCGIYTVLLAAVFYLFYQKKSVSTLGGVLISLMMFPAPMGMFAVHWYDPEKGKSRKYLFYVLYLAHLVILAAIALLMRR